jgi:hypothetical protein
VPVLIDAVGDQRFTRMVVGQLPAAHPHHLTCIPIGRCASDLLTRIIGGAPKGINMWPSNSADGRLAQAAWREYWDWRISSEPRDRK